MLVLTSPCWMFSWSSNGSLRILGHLAAIRRTSRSSGNPREPGRSPRAAPPDSRRSLRGRAGPSYGLPGRAATVLATGAPSRKRQLATAGHRHANPLGHNTKAGVRLGHAKLDTTALYTRVANTTIRNVTGPLDRLASLPVGRPRPGV